MAAFVRLDQVGLSAGEAGKSRTVGLANGAKITVTNTNPAASVSDVELLWVPVGDSTSLATLVRVAENVFEFSPTPNRYGKFRIKVTENPGTALERVEIRTFGIRMPNGLLPPALNESANPLATSMNGSLHIDESEDNADDYPDSDLNGVRFAGWMRSMYELFEKVQDPSGDTGPAPANIYVDNVDGDDGNDGSESSPILTMREARARIGTKNGDVTIWLYSEGAPGGTHNITDSSWSVPRVGAGKVTIRGAIAPVGDPVNIVDSELLKNVQRLTLDPNPIIDTSFIWIGDDETGYATSSFFSYGDHLYIPTFSDLSGQQIRSAQTLASLTANNPRGIRCGSSIGPFDSSDVSSLEMKHLSVNAVIHSGALLLDCVHLNYSRLSGVSIGGSNVIAFAGTTFANCHTPQGLSGRFRFARFTNCGGSANASSNNDVPFNLGGVINYLKATRSFMVVSGTFSAHEGSVVDEVLDSRLSFYGVAVGNFNVNKSVNCDLYLKLFERNDSVFPSGLSGLMLMSSRVEIDPEESSPDWTSFAPKLAGGSLLLSHKDMSSAPYLAGLDFSSSEAAYAFVDGSVLARAGSFLDNLSSVKARVHRAGGSYVVRHDPIGFSFGPIPDTESEIGYIEVQANCTFEANLTISCTDDAGTPNKYLLNYRVIGTAGASAIESMSAQQVYTATNDDQAVAVTGITVAFSISSNMVQVEVTNGLGGGAEISASASYELEVRL